MTLRAFGEDDRHLDDLVTLPPETVVHLDLEAVTVGLDFIELLRQECTTGETFESSSRVGDAHAGDV